MSDPAIIAPVSTPEKPKRGCFFYGCITGIVLLVIVIIAGIAGVYVVKKKINSFVVQYTDTQPMTMPTVNLSSEEIARVKGRFKDFETAVREGKATSPLVLNSDEVNVLITSSDAAKDVKGKFYVSLDGDKVKGDVSIPLDEFAKSPILSAAKGRYLNGSGTFNVSLHNGELVVSPDSIKVKGNELPDQFMAGIRNVNFASGVTNDASAMSTLNKLQEIDVKDGKLTVVPKGSAAGDAEKSTK